MKDESPFKAAKATFRIPVQYLSNLVEFVSSVGLLRSESVLSVN